MARCLNPVQYRHHHTRLWALSLISLVLLSLLGGCKGGNSAEDAIDPNLSSVPETLSGALDDPIAQPLTSLPSPAGDLVTASQIVQVRARRLVVPADPVAVDLYTLDDTCDTYQVEPIQVPRFQSMENTVGLILAEQTIPDLTLSGYRATYDLTTKTTTIDLRVSLDSRRVLQSLSLCEQKALLGSLRETLINQPDWNIEAVVFTNRGNDLVL